MAEVWKAVIGFENYQVSSEGNVRSIDHVSYDRLGKKHSIKGKVLIPRQDRYGYLQVNLYQGSKKSRCMKKVHRLVAEAFIDKKSESENCINHIDENKKNNHAENLEWCSVAYNNLYGGRIKRVFSTLKANKRRTILDITGIKA